MQLRFTFDNAFVGKGSREVTFMTVLIMAVRRPSSTVRTDSVFRFSLAGTCDVIRDVIRITVLAHPHGNERSYANIVSIHEHQRSTGLKKVIGGNGPDAL